MMKFEGNVGCMYLLRYENHRNDNITTELLWYSNLETPLEEMDDDELGETMDYIFKDTYGDIVKEVDDWQPVWGLPAYENIGWDVIRIVREHKDFKR